MFKWVTNNIVKILIKDGTELLLDVNNNFTEIAYNVIPLYDDSIRTQRNYFYD